MLVPKQRLYQLPGALLKAEQIPSQFVSEFVVQETIPDSQNVLDDLKWTWKGDLEPAWCGCSHPQKGQTPI